MKYLIRQATTADSHDVARFMQPIVKAFVTHEFTAQGEKIMLDSMSEEAIKKNIQGDYCYLLATEPESAKILGVIGVKAKNHLFHLFVDPESHSSGVGKTLWQHYLAGSQETEFTVNSSKIAVGFYKKLGFESKGGTFEKNGITCYPMVLRLKH